MSCTTFTVNSIAGGVRFSSWVQSGASLDAVIGPYGDALKIAVSAPSADGQANDAIRRLLASVLHVPRSSVTIMSGDLARTKVVQVLGITREEALARLTPDVLA